VSFPIHVDAYSGYKANERPCEFTLDEQIYEIAAVLDQWYEPSATYFKVQSTEGKTYLLRYDEEADEGTLQSGFDGDELLARPSIELVTVDSAIAKKAEQRIESCERCHPADAEIPFDWLLAEVTGRRRHQQYLRSQHPEQFQGSDRRGERGVKRLKGRRALSARPWMYSASCLRRKRFSPASASN
jgi:hypothetical protein